MAKVATLVMEAVTAAAEQVVERAEEDGWRSNHYMQCHRWQLPGRKRGSFASLCMWCLRYRTDCCIRSAKPRSAAAGRALPRRGGRTPPSTLWRRFAVCQKFCPFTMAGERGLLPVEPLHTDRPNRGGSWHRGSSNHMTRASLPRRLPAPHTAGVLSRCSSVILYLKVVGGSPSHD